MSTISYFSSVSHIHSYTLFARVSSRLIDRQEVAQLSIQLKQGKFTTHGNQKITCRGISQKVLKDWIGGGYQPMISLFYNFSLPSTWAEIQTVKQRSGTVRGNIFQDMATNTWQLKSNIQWGLTKIPQRLDWRGISDYYFIFKQFFCTTNMG